MKLNKEVVEAFEESSISVISNNVLEIYFHLVELYKSYGLSNGKAKNKADKIIEEAFTKWRKSRHQYKGETFINNVFAM